MQHNAARVSSLLHLPDQDSRADAGSTQVIHLTQRHQLSPKYVIQLLLFLQNRVQVLKFHRPKNHSIGRDYREKKSLTKNSHATVPLT